MKISWCLKNVEIDPKMNNAIKDRTKLLEIIRKLHVYLLAEEE
jgi:hypothetical protein